MTNPENNHHHTSWYFTILDKAGHYAQRWHQYWLAWNPAGADQRYLGEGQYILLEEVRKIFGGYLPEQPYNGKPLEIQFGRYVYPAEWKQPILDLQRSFAAGKRVFEVQTDQWGSYTLDMYWKLKQRWKQAKAEGLDILLAQFDDILLVETQPH